MSEEVCTFPDNTCRHCVRRVGGVGGIGAVQVIEVPSHAFAPPSPPSKCPGKTLPKKLQTYLTSEAMSWAVMVSN